MELSYRFAFVTHSSPCGLVHASSWTMHPLRSRPITALLRYYGRCDSCPPRRVTVGSTAVNSVNGQVSLFHVLGLPTIPSPTTCGCSASPRHATCRRVEPRPHPNGTHPNGNSGLRHSLASSPHHAGRIEFLIVRTGRSPPVALHPVSRRRSYVRLQVDVYLERTFASPTKHTHRRGSGALGAPGRRGEKFGELQLLDELRKRPGKPDS